MSNALEIDTALLSKSDQRKQNKQILKRKKIILLILLGSILMLGFGIPAFTACQPGTIWCPPNGQCGQGILLVLKYELCNTETCGGFLNCSQHSCVESTHNCSTDDTSDVAVQCIDANDDFRICPHASNSTAWYFMVFIIAMIMTIIGVILLCSVLLRCPV